MFALVSLVAFSLGAGAVLLSRLSRPKPLTFTRVAPLTTYPGNELQPALSHDGKQVAFVWGGEKGGNYDIYVKLLDIGSPVRLTSDPAYDLTPQWSPDDRYMSFLRVSEKGMAVYVVPALGGVERKVADLHMATAWKADAIQVQVGSGPAWSADGTELIVSDAGLDGTGALSLYAVPLDGSARRRLTTPPTSVVRDFYPVVAHRGHKMAFLRETSNSSGDLFVLNTDDGDLRQVTFDHMRIRGLAWSPDDRSLIFASNRGGADGLWQVPANGGSPERIPSTGYQVSYLSTSSDGSVLAYTATIENTNIWRLPLTKAGETAPKPELLISSTGMNDSPRYSPDGRKIVFVSNRSGTWELWIANSDGTNLRQMTNFGGPMTGTPHWSPDSRFVVFDARPKGRSLIYTIAVDGGTPQVAVDDGFEDKKPNWSRDGQSLYYTSNRGGQAQLWRSGIHGEHPVRLTSGTCDDSAESVDGKYIYFQNDQNGIYRLPIGGGTPELIPELAGVYPSRYFDVLDQIYFLDQENAPRLIRQFDPASHKLSTIGAIDRQLVYGTPSLSVSPDHRFLLFAQQDNSSSEIMALRK